MFMGFRTQTPMESQLNTRFTGFRTEIINFPFETTPETHVSRKCEQNWMQNQ